MAKPRILRRVEKNTERDNCILKKNTHTNISLNVLYASENGDRDRISRST